MSFTSENLLEIETELASINAEIAALTTVLASLQEGEYKKKYVVFTN